jgi:hypothetical protein
MKLGFNKMSVVDCVGRSDGLTLLSNNEIDMEIQTTVVGTLMLQLKQMVLHLLAVGNLQVFTSTLKQLKDMRHRDY